VSEGLSVTLLTPPTAETGVPRYRQIADQLAELIVRAGPGLRLPSENEIARHLRVSRATAIQALRELEQRGLVLRMQGRGSFTADARRAIRSATSGPLPSFSEDLRHAGRITHERVLSCELKSPPPEVSAGLSLEEQAVAWRVVRVILSDEHPVVHVTSWLPGSLYPELDATAIASGSLYQHLESTYGPGGRPSSADEQWSAQAASRSIAKILEIRSGSPVMRVQRVAYLDDGTPAEHSNSYVRGETFVVSFHVVAGGARDAVALPADVLSS
jgi:GntR family transcriptional regulator